jgi:hypothetical protein
VVNHPEVVKAYLGERFAARERERQRGGQKTNGQEPVQYPPD